MYPFQYYPTIYIKISYVFPSRNNFQLNSERSYCFFDA
jgi:hypothetical protein